MQLKEKEGIGISWLLEKRESVSSKMWSPVSYLHATGWLYTKAHIKIE